MTGDDVTPIGMPAPEQVQAGPSPVPTHFGIAAHPAGLVIMEITCATGTHVFFLQPDGAKRVASLLVDAATKIKAGNMPKLIVPPPGPLDLNGHGPS